MHALSDRYTTCHSSGNTLTEDLVRKRIALLKEAWKDVGKYPCMCRGAQMIALYGNHSLLCCKTNDATPSQDACTCLDGETQSPACCANGNNFLPESLDVLFDEVPADEVVDAVINLINPYMRRIMTEKNNLAFKKYNDPKKVEKWDWVAQGLGELAAKASGLYSTVDPIMYYNASEAGFPFRREATVWETCAGLVSQVGCVVLELRFNQYSQNEFPPRNM